MQLRTKLRLEVATSPSLWLRNSVTDIEFDKWLWDAMEFGAKPTPAYHGSAPDPNWLSAHEVMFLGQKVWSGNAPYADAALHGRSASRTTALRFRRLVQKMRANSAPAGLPDPFEFLFGKDIKETT